MPSFCRHGTVAERCPICRPSLEDDARTAATRAPRTPASRRSATSHDTRPARAGGAARARSGLTVRREARAEDDGYRSALAPGLRSRADAQRLAAELGYAAGRLELLSSDPPGLYAFVASESDLEEATWAALLIAYLGPLEEPSAFATIDELRTSWRSGDLPVLLPSTALGPRAAHASGRSTETLDAYRRWALRAGSQTAAFTADASWTPQQRFERVFERLALPGLHRRARFDLLTTLGRLGRYPLSAGALLLSEDDPVLAAAKRVFGIGDRLTLERRARALSEAAGTPIAALDLALENWARPGSPISLGARVPAVDAHDGALAALDCAP